MHPSWIPPPEIGQFHLERHLGRGATADVWLARDALLDRVVALKIASSPASEATRARFRAEARAIAKLHHPNIVGIHHVGEVAGRPYLVTEYLSGRSLDALDRPMDIELVVAIGIDLARGLAAAHHAGILHRDIKPANAFLAEDGVAKLLDFGLAKVEEGPLAFAKTELSALGHSEARACDTTDGVGTLSGRLAGTPLYMAPETWRGTAASRPTDVYSLGALLFELLTGGPPCDARTLVALREQVLAGRTADLAAGAPSAPAAVVELVNRCLRLAPEQRPTADDLCDALARAIRHSSLVPEPLDDPRRNPYRGLSAFGPEHRGVFFGREAETAAVIAELRANPFVLVTGPSGAGKSSLVRAGVVPRVEKGAFGIGAEWQAIVLVPGGRPVDALAQAVAPLLGVSETTAAGELASSPGWLAGELRTVQTRLLLVVDQLEEVWTLATAPDREAFFAIIAALGVSARTVRVVATVRSDFLARLEDMGDLQAPALSALIALRPMTREGLRRAIVEPALRRGVEIEPALVERLMGVGGSPRPDQEEGSLPLLEFTLAELYAGRDAAKSTVDEADLDALGGVAGALATHADAALARMPATVRVEARRLLLALVTTERTRARREEHDLPRGGPEARRALDALVEARLVVATPGEHGGAFEVAHEALLSGWPALRAWLDEEAATREVVERLHRAAAEWERVGRAEGALFGPRQLAEVELVAAAVDPRDRPFVEASRAALRKARARRLALRVGAPLGAALLAVAIAGALEWSARRQARAFVAARLAEADAAMLDVRSLDAEVASARREAFARYDAGDFAAGEARWREALALGRRESNAFVVASAPLGLALARDPLDPGARARGADLAYEWLLAAERDHDRSVARDMVGRVAQLDDDGSRRVRLAAMAHLRVATVPPGARVVLRPVHVEADGRRVEGGEAASGEAPPSLEAERAIAEDTDVELAPGSYILEATAPGRYTTRSPILLRRAQYERVEIPLPPTSSIAPGFLYVPAGTSLVGAADAEMLRTAFRAEPEHAVHIEGFLIAEREVTYAEYLDFLASLPPAERSSRHPRATNLELVYDGDGAASLKLREGTAAARGAPICRPARSARRCQDWLRFPVAGVSRDDAQAYVAWLGRRLPGARLCSEREWERAARGADGRLYPHGDVLLPGDANDEATYAEDDDQMGIDEVGSFPVDRSPFGVLDLGGNAREWIASDGSLPSARGGLWYDSPFNARSSSRYVYGDEDRDDGVGVRVCAPAPTVP